MRFFQMYCSTDDEVGHTIRRYNSIQKQEALIVKEWFGMKRQEALQGCADLLKANHASAKLFEG